MRGFHASLQKFKQFDVTLAGQNTQDDSAFLALFFSTSAAVAKTYIHKQVVIRGHYTKELKRVEHRISELESLVKNNLGNPETYAELTELENERMNIDVILHQHINAELPTQELIDGGHVYEVDIKLENPMTVNLSGGSWDEKQYTSLLLAAKNTGYDGVIFKHVCDTADGSPVVSDIIAVFDAQKVQILNPPEVDLY